MFSIYCHGICHIITYDGFCILYSREFSSAFLMSSSYLSMKHAGAMKRRHDLGPVVIILLKADLKSLLNIEYITGLKLELEYPNHVRILNAVGEIHS